MPKTLDFKNPHLLRNDVEYKAALREVEELMGRECPPGSRDRERLEFLSVLVEAYEDEEFPIENPSPQAVLEFLLDQRGLTRAYLVDILGSKSRVSEFFSGKRHLSLNQVRAIREEFGIPADLLIAEK